MAESKRDYYEVLGVSKDADEATLKKAYRQVAKKYHPDMNPGDAEAEKKFKEASEAYAVLSDPEKRRQYDQFGHAAFDGSAGAGGGYGGFDFNGADFGDIFGDIFGDLFGGGRRAGRANQGPMKGMNIRKSVRITFEEAVFGCEKELDVVLKDPCPKCNGTGAKPGTSPETCPKCGGKGQVVYTQQSFFGTVQNVQTCPDCQGTGKIIKEKCPDCGGTGYVASKKKISVSIPAGIDNGQSVRIREKGEPGVNGGLVARVKAVLRRYQVGSKPETPQADKGKCVEYPGIEINLTNYSVIVDGHTVEMPPKELELLYFLASSPNQVFTREQLLDQIWGYEYIGDTRTVDVHIKRLREKIKDHNGWSLSTVWGIGYKFEVK